MIEMFTFNFVFCANVRTTRHSQDATRDKRQHLSFLHGQNKLKFTFLSTGFGQGIAHLQDNVRLITRGIRTLFRTRPERREERSYCIFRFVRVKRHDVIGGSSSFINGSAVLVMWNDSQAFSCEVFLTVLMSFAPFQSMV